MKIKHNNGRKSDNGYIYIASLKSFYYHLAVYSANTLKDYYPDAHVTLFTHENFLDKSSDVFDNIVTEIPIYYRSKMWCMARTPYKNTLYIDADSYIAHKDIKIAFDELNDCDMYFGPVKPYTTADIAWSYIDKAMTIMPQYHGAVCGYKSTELTLDFMQTWYDEYIKQVSEPWPYSFADPKWKVFDMFVLWRMTSGRFSEFDRFNDLKIKQVSDRYTVTAQHIPSDKKSPIIHLVDSHTFKRISGFQHIIDESIHHGIYPSKKYPINKAPEQYN